MKPLYLYTDHIQRLCGNYLGGHDLFYFLTAYIGLFFNLCFTLYIWIQNNKVKFWSFFFSLLIFLIEFIVSYIISFSYRQTFQIIQNSFYSVSLHIYSETLYGKIYGSCSRNCMKDIWVVPPEYVPYNFSNMICIFLHFFLM